MNYRHGDLGLIGIDKLPDDLIETKTNIIMKGSHGNNHIFQNGILYLKNVDQFVFGYFKANDGCKLFHVEHGEIVEGNNLRIANIEPGFYELRKQNEFTHDGMKQVID